MRLQFVIKCPNTSQVELSFSLGHALSVMSLITAASGCTNSYLSDGFCDTCSLSAKCHTTTLVESRHIYKDVLLYRLPL